ncbi:MAG: T9SS type A sorting domain-containing protein [Parabacteroides gordonii]|nr:T9SS type A sorting domain-containing protein [Parabacteroides gordonii]
MTTSRGDAISPRSSDGAYLVKYVRTDVAITISGVVKNPDPVANAELHTGSTITARDGLLLITTDRPTEAQVVALTGQLIRSLALPSGTTRIDGLADGIYIVRLSDGTVQKVIVRK